MTVLSLESAPFVCTWGFSLLYLGYGSIIVSVMSVSPDSQPLRFIARMTATRVLLVVGLSSYSIYLWHWNLVRMPMLRFAAHHPDICAPGLELACLHGGLLARRNADRLHERPAGRVSGTSPARSLVPPRCETRPGRHG